MSRVGFHINLLQINDSKIPLHTHTKTPYTAKVAVI